MTNGDSCSQTLSTSSFHDVFEDRMITRRFESQRLWNPMLNDCFVRLNLVTLRFLLERFYFAKPVTLSVETRKINFD